MGRRTTLPSSVPPLFFASTMIFILLSRQSTSLSINKLHLLYINSRSSHRALQVPVISTARKMSSKPNASADNHDNNQASGSINPCKYHVAIIGGGITGATAFQTLSKYNNLHIHLFDQGRRGVGGRSSSRTHKIEDGNGNGDGDVVETTMMWDHGCQFFRGDTPEFQPLLKDWISKDLVTEWKGNFASSPSLSREREFFGFPSQPPFYAGIGGMQNIAKGIVDDILLSNDNSAEAYLGTRVAKLNRDEKTKRWTLFAAYHDPPKNIVKESQPHQQSADRDEDGNGVLGHPSGYDAIILTDVSSSFGKWHRASAGVPEAFASRVRRRVGARVPLFSAMIAFEMKSGISVDAASFDNDIVWFAAKSNSKPGLLSESDASRECWTIVSTPEYAMSKIEETPMQDQNTGEFIPQSKEYLTTVPGPDLSNEFCKELLSSGGILNGNLKELPNIVFLDAQRWGSAMPCHRHLTEDSETRKIISDVPYDSARASLAPTKLERVRDDESDHKEDRVRSFLVDEGLMLFQAGDMMSMYTPGLEGAALSGYDAAEYLAGLLCRGSD
ncbi:hypothetical protein ACHAXS_008612 [Conticribra weissflogii]